MYIIYCDKSPICDTSYEKLKNNIINIDNTYEYNIIDKCYFRIFIMLNNKVILSDNYYFYT